MKIIKLIYRIAFLVCLFWLAINTAKAHEAYLIEHDLFWDSLAKQFSGQAFEALNNPHNVNIFLFVSLAATLLLTLNFLFRRTKFSLRLGAWQENFAHYGPHIVRFSVAISLFFSAVQNVFLGPELPLSDFPFGSIVRVILLAASILLFFGLFTEIAAFLGITVFLLAMSVRGGYMFTYANYFGEFIVLILFGMRVFSLDKYLFGPLRQFRYWEKYETAIVRGFYGFGLIFAGLTVKFLHPELTLQVVNDWHLTQFHWLFPSDPLLIVFGGGLAEIVIGLFIILGFEMRLMVAVSLFYITLSLLYFREQVWPHILMYGISLNLLLQPETLTLDHLFFAEHRKKLAWWRRIVKPHNILGKSEVKT